MIHLSASDGVFMALDCLIFLKTPSDGVTMKSRVPGIILVRGTVLEIGCGFRESGSWSFDHAWCSDSVYKLMAFMSEDESSHGGSKRTSRVLLNDGDKNQRAFVRGSWSNSGEEDDEKVKDETCLVAHASSEVCSESSYFSDENSSIDDLALRQ
ncbi:hypothetical protein Tco_0706130 [Tanacetum coccineum]|uniref:Uncharacterized protein n=1 Tax=Tanacetum coccineum TaxID=301880 RepID=A0ABQ4Y6I4_9ASTR